MFDNLEKHLPVVRELIANKVLPQLKDKSREILQDNKKLEPILAKTYDLLPLTVRLIVGKDKFVFFCINQKDKIFPSTMI